MSSVLEQLVLPSPGNDDRSILCMYAEDNILYLGSSDSDSETDSETDSDSDSVIAYNDMDETELFSQYRVQFNKGFRDEHILGENIDDYMYTADTSAAIRYILSYYSPYKGRIVSSFPVEKRYTYTLKDYQDCALLFETLDEHTARILSDLELCASTGITIITDECKRRQNSGEEPPNLMELTASVFDVLIQSEDYPSLNEFSTNIRRRYLGQAIANRTYYLLCLNRGL